MGSMSAGAVSDMLLFQRRDVTSCVYAALCLPATLGVMLCTIVIKHTPYPPTSNDSVSQVFSLSHMCLAVCMFCIGVGINGPKTLVGMCVREGVPAKRVGLIGGILGTI